jgi:plasmid stability protein
MATMTIRGLTETARTELAARAARRGQSMQEFVRMLLEAEAASPDLEDLVGRIARRKETTGTSVPVERILAAKDADHR